MYVLQAADCRDGCAQERTFLSQFRLAMLFGLLSLSFGLHTRLTQASEHIHSHDIACSVLLVVASIMLTVGAVRTFLNNTHRLVTGRGFLGLDALYNSMFLVVCTMVFIVVIIAIVDDADDQT